MRLFFALWPEPAVRAVLAQRIAGITLPEGRRVRRENLHATLVFLGEVEVASVSALRLAAAGVAAPAFEIVLDTIGAFPRAGVVWIGASALPEAAGRLVAALREALGAAGFAFDPKPFTLHVTIARDVKDRWRPPAFPPLAWPVASFALVASVTGPAGAVYDVLDTWPLAAPGAHETALPSVR